MAHAALAFILQGAVAVDPTLLTVMQWAVIVAAVAIVVQTILLLSMALAVRAMKKQVSDLAGKVEPVTEQVKSLVTRVEPIADSAKQTLETANRILAEVRGYAQEYSAKGSELLDLTRKQMGRVDEFMAEATTRTRAQMDRVEMVIDDTVNRFQETTALLQNGIVRPLRQVVGITAGVRTAINAIFGARRATVEEATHDEEMFI